MAAISTSIETAVNATNKQPGHSNGLAVIWTILICVCAAAIAIAIGACLIFRRYQRRQQQTALDASTIEALPLPSYTASSQRPSAPTPEASSIMRAAMETPDPDPQPESLPEPMREPLPEPSRSHSKTMPAESYSRLRETVTPSKSANHQHARALPKGLKESISESSMRSNQSGRIGRAY